MVKYSNETRQFVVTEQVAAQVREVTLHKKDTVCKGGYSVLTIDDHVSHNNFVKHSLISSHYSNDLYVKSMIRV